MQKILMVCLGNICRSPLAEGILKNKAKNLNLDIFIDSAGTSNYHINEHPDARAILCAKKHNINISKFEARQFIVQDFDLFDKIYVMDNNNYTEVILLARNNQDKEKVEFILNSISPKANASVPDPYFSEEQGFEDVFALLDRACEEIANFILNTK